MTIPAISEVRVRAVDAPIDPPLRNSPDAIGRGRASMVATAARRGAGPQGGARRISLSAGRMLLGLGALLLWPMPLHGQDAALDRGTRLQNFSSLQLSIGTVRASQGACRVEASALEAVGVQILTEAGLATLTIDESLEISRSGGEVVRRHLEILRTGRAFSDAERAEAERLRLSTAFMRNLPWLMIMVATEAYQASSGEILCGIAISGDFSAPPLGRPTIGATNRATLAPLILWRHATLAAVSRPADVAEKTIDLLRAITAAFVSAWKAQNGRP